MGRKAVKMILGVISSQSGVSYRMVAWQEVVVDFIRSAYDSGPVLTRRLIVNTNALSHLEHPEKFLGRSAAALPVTLVSVRSVNNARWNHQIVVWWQHRKYPGRP